jgi:putative tricarboxylic transport membrane protein
MLTNDRIGGLLIGAFSLAYGLLTFQIPLLPFQAQVAFTARTMPEALAVLGLVLSLLLIVKPSSGARPEVSGFLWGRVALVCLTMVAYGLTIRSGGFLISTTLFLISGFVILGERRPFLILASSLPIVIAFWVLMSQFLGVYVEPWPEFLKEM